jgi:hypothetical protein
MLPTNRLRNADACRAEGLIFLIVGTEHRRNGPPTPRPRRPTRNSVVKAAAAALASLTIEPIFTKSAGGAAIASGAAITNDTFLMVPPRTHIAGRSHR